MEEKPIQLYCPKCKIGRGPLNEVGELLRMGLSREKKIEILRCFSQPDGVSFLPCPKCKTNMELE